MLRIPCAMPFSVVPKRLSSRRTVGVALGAARACAQQADLQQRQRVDVRVAQRDRPLQDAVCPSSRLARSRMPCSALHGALELRRQRVEQRRRRRPARSRTRARSSRSAFAHTISILPAGRRRTASARHAAQQRERRPGVAARSSSAVPTPSQPGSIRRICVQPKSQGIARMPVDAARRARDTPGASRSARARARAPASRRRNSANSRVSSCTRPRYTRARPLGRAHPSRRGSASPRPASHGLAPVAERLQQRARQRHLQRALGDRRAGRTAAR